MLTYANYAKAHFIAVLLLAAGVSINCQAQETSSPQAITSEAQSIVEKSDRIRFPAEGFQVDVSIETTNADKSTEQRKYRVLSKGNENSVVMTTEPAVDRGQVILMKGRDLWVFMPDVSQPIRLSLAQRLTGQVANGDLARANFSGDYVPSIVGTETLAGEEHHVLDLKAVDRGVTYQRVKYWVNKKNFRPLKAEFYSLSNRLLKRCSYDNYQEMAGGFRPARLVMEDALKAGEQSVLEYQSMKLRDLPDKIFTKDYLKKLN